MCKVILVECSDIGSNDDGPFRSYSLYSEGATLLELVNYAYVTEVDQDGGDHAGGLLTEYRHNVYMNGVAAIRESCNENGIQVPVTPCEECGVAEATVDGQYCKSCVPLVEAKEAYRRKAIEDNARFHREYESRLEYCQKYGIKARRTYEEFLADAARGVPAWSSVKESTGD